MAASSGKKTSSSGKRSSRTNTKSKSTKAKQAAQDSALFHEIGLLILLVVMLILFFCNFGIIGPVGDAISSVMFGLFGLTAYIAPIMLFVAIAFWFANEGNPTGIKNRAIRPPSKRLRPTCTPNESIEKARKDLARSFKSNQAFLAFQPL